MAEGGGKVEPTSSSSSPEVVNGKENDKQVENSGENKVKWTATKPEKKKKRFT